jgi:hypothetical protein
MAMAAADARNEIELALIETRRFRCDVTGNLCGTASWAQRGECRCSGCREWFRAVNDRVDRVIEGHMPDREIALAILAVNDADDLDHARQLIADHGQHFDAWLSGAHDGDCTKRPYTCMRCVAEDALAKVPLGRTQIRPDLLKVAI